ncbi:hypothetical protein [Paenibacillus puerhi]|uniref:hypothetical protein n=1 Tax=Paenibacillus puerhi TaxID=2692622 RepID=UPI00135C641B|nr:hypothetical protein [Paenibacillus puerhi]
MNDINEGWNHDEKRLKKTIIIKMLRTIGIFLGILLFVVALGVYGLFRLVASACGNEIVNEIPQPGGALKAVVFIRDCGATTRESYQVSIIRKGSNIDDTDTGNVFIAYEPVSVSWSKYNDFDIEYAGGQVFKQEINVKGIRVNYK